MPETTRTPGRLPAAFLILLGIVLCACRKQPPLPVYWQLAPFHLTAQSGQPFDSQTLAGKIWVADFIYTTCPGPCPRMTSQMRGIQSATQSLPDVRLVSFTVDPKNDTPAVLAAYASHFHADARRWFFLTGDRSALEDVYRNGFKLGDVDGSLVHSTRFILLDRGSRVRGIYSPTEDDGALAHLLRDIRALEKEPDVRS